MLLRAFDIIFSLFGLILLLPIFLIILILGFFDTGSPLFIQERVGRNKKSFNLIKFRTMELDTENVASHLASSRKITNFGRFLRKTKIDELPQLLNVFIGSMSFVGPRPNLFNQEELIKARDSLSVYNSRPGITGLAQINPQPSGLKSWKKSIKLDVYYTTKVSFFLDVQIIFKTVELVLLQKKQYKDFKKFYE